MNILNNASVSAAGSAVIKNDGTLTPVFQLVVQSTTPPSAGATPQLIFSVGTSIDGVRAKTLLTLPAITGALAAPINDIVDANFDGYVHISWSLPDPTAVFPNVTADLWGDTLTHDIMEVPI